MGSNPAELCKQMLAKKKWNPRKQVLRQLPRRLRGRKANVRATARSSQQNLCASQEPGAPKACSYRKHRATAPRKAQGQARQQGAGQEAPNRASLPRQQGENKHRNERKKQGRGQGNNKGPTAGAETQGFVVARKPQTATTRFKE